MAFVGRDRELDQLERELALAFELPAGRSVFVQGPPGAGKTAVVSEFLDRLVAQRPDVTIARGRCLQTFGSADPYLPFVEALRDLTDDTPSGIMKRETVAEVIAELAPYWLSVVPVVGGLLSAGFATAARLRGGPSDAAPSREALFVQYLEVVQRLAQQAPLVLFLDDLHWADQSSVALLNHISRGVTHLPVLILGTLRSDEAELEQHPITGLIRELEREGIGRALGLGELAPEALGALLAAEFGGDVAEPLRRWVLDTAGGNPLFASELARLLRQSGGVVEVRGEWQLTAAAAELEVPRSAEAVIESRIQRLDPEEVKLLQYASVEGNEFDSVVLARLLERDELELLDALEKLERRYRLVESTGEMELPDGEVATTFRFHHALVQTVLYRQVLGKRRVLLHRKAGELLQTLFQSAPEAVAGRLARHFHQGRVSELAYHYARQAAEGARRLYAHWEAEELYRIALEHAPGEEERRDLQERLGDVYYTVGYQEQATAAYEAALAARSDARGGLRIRRKMAVIERKAGLVPAPVLLQRLRALADEAAAVPEERCRLLLEIVYLPNAVEVVRTAEEAVALAEGTGDPALLAQALEQLALLLAFAGEAERAFPLLDRAYRIGSGAEDPVRGSRYHEIRGIAHAKLGQYRQALDAFEHKLALSERMGNPHFIGAACNNLGQALLILGEYERAEEVLQRGLIINERRNRVGLVHCLLSLARCAHWQGDLPFALQRYTQLLEQAHAVEYWTTEAVAYAGIGLCQLEQDDLAAARQACWRAAAVVADQEAWFEDREMVEILRARLEAIDGDPEAGAARLRQVAARLAEADLFVWTQVELERVRILLRFDPAAAREALRAVVAATRGAELSMDVQIDELRRELLSDDAVEISPPTR